MNEDLRHITVSVVILTYNHKDYIEECLRSILAQKTNFKYEIILGEDESSDGTREICKQYAAKYPDRIRLFLRSRKDVIYHGGRPTGRYNMIESLKAARGAYVACCEGDDYWSDELKLQKQVDVLKDNPDCIASHHWQKFAIKDGDNWKEVAAPKEGHGYNDELKLGVQEIFANHVRVKSRTILFRNIINEDFFPPWFSTVAFGDVPLTFLLGQHGKFHFMDQEMAVYRRTQTGRSTEGRDELTQSQFIERRFKDWIIIWDHANRLYGYRYNKEAERTIHEFFDHIVRSSQQRRKVIWSLSVFNLLSRSTRLKNKWIDFFWLFGQLSVK